MRLFLLDKPLRLRYYSYIKAMIRESNMHLSLKRAQSPAESCAGELYMKQPPFELLRDF